jgi:magnesium transporter
MDEEPEPAWVDLLDPDEGALRDSVPAELDPTAVGRLVAGSGERRPAVESFGAYVVGTLLAPVAVTEEDEVFYQEIGFVLTRDQLVTIRKTPPGRPPFDPGEAKKSCRPGEPPAMHAFHLVDFVADRYIDLTDAVNEEIDEIEDNLDLWSIERIRDRVVRLRHDLLHLRRVLAPTRDAVRQIVDGRLDLEGESLFTREVELHFADVYDKLLRASDALDLARDLLANVRDAYQTKIAFNQNTVLNRLTIIASLLLLPTFIVGLYGQNFLKMPEYQWGVWGYVWSWGWIIGTTVIQLWYFRRKRWI